MNWIIITVNLCSTAIGFLMRNSNLFRILILTVWICARICKKRICKISSKYRIHFLRNIFQFARVNLTSVYCFTCLNFLNSELEKSRQNTTVTINLKFSEKRALSLHSARTSNNSEPETGENFSKRFSMKTKWIISFQNSVKSQLQLSAIKIATSVEICPENCYHWNQNCWWLSKLSQLNLFRILILTVWICAQICKKRICKISSKYRIHFLFWST